MQLRRAEKHGKRPHRLAGPGQRPFTPSTAVQIRLGTPNEIKPLREIVRAFSLWGRFAPPSAPQIFKILFSLQAGTERNGCSSQEWVFQPQMDTY